MLSCNLRHFGGAFPVASVAHASTATLAMGVTPLPLRNTIATFFRQAKSTHNFPPPSPWGWVTFLPWRHAVYREYCWKHLFFTIAAVVVRVRVHYATLRYATLHFTPTAAHARVKSRGGGATMLTGGIPFFFFSSSSFMSSSVKNVNVCA